MTNISSVNECVIMFLYIFMSRHDPLPCSKGNCYLKANSPFPTARLDKYIRRVGARTSSQLGLGCCPNVDIMLEENGNVALQINEKNKRFSALWGTLFMLAMSTNTAIVNVDQLAVRWYHPPFVCFRSCVEVLSLHLNEHFSSGRMKSFCQPPLIVDD